MEIFQKIFLGFVILYVLPVGLVLIKKISKRTRYFIISIPVFTTLLFFGFLLIEIREEKELDKKYPQINNLTFEERPENVRDSILVLQDFMIKISKGWKDNEMSYEIRKYRDFHNYFTLNRYWLGKFEDLVHDSVFRNLQIPESKKADWINNISEDIVPFDTLTQSEASRFINLIKYLDSNKLNSAFLHRGRIGLQYNDSLRIWKGTDFRSITIDTLGFSNSHDYEILDEKGGIYLIKYNDYYTY
ncbi:hypothetical protein ACFQ5N_08455 [Lutibacter holmesii]|uniref:Uncharacterized protein n=1 Tax=Lutibacter holmesii TaxID=1137985 RepID=A0ABW3WQ31_9FLAO